MFDLAALHIMFKMWCTLHYVMLNTVSAWSVVHIYLQTYWPAIHALITLLAHKQCIKYSAYCFSADCPVTFTVTLDPSSCFSRTVPLEWIVDIIENWRSVVMSWIKWSTANIRLLHWHCICNSLSKGYTLCWTSTRSPIVYTIESEQSS